MKKTKRYTEKSLLAQIGPLQERLQILRRNEWEKNAKKIIGTYWKTPRPSGFVYIRYSGINDHMLFSTMYFSVESDRVVIQKGTSARCPDQPDTQITEQEFETAWNACLKAVLNMPVLK